MSATASLLLDGVNDVASASHNAELNITGDLTLEFWLKATDHASGTTTILGFPNDVGGSAGYRAVLDFNLFFLEDWNAYTVNQATPVTLNSGDIGAWHHYAITRTGRAVAYYRDGAFLGSGGTMSGTAAGNTGGVALGLHMYRNYGKGKFCEVRIWNVARSSGDIAAYYDKKAAGSETDLVACWHLGEGTGTTTADATSPAETLTISGATWDTGDFPTLTDAGSGTQTVTASAIASAEAFGTAVLTPGAVTVSPSAISSAAAFGTAVLTPGAVTVSPSSIASAEAFGSTVVDDGSIPSQTVTASAIATAEAFGTPALYRRARPVLDLSAGGWTTHAGGTTGLAATIDETAADDADYVRSSASPATEDVYRFRFAPVPNPLAGITGGVRVLLRYQKDSGTDRIDLAFRLYAADGVTLITEAGAADISTSLTDGVIVLSLPNIQDVPFDDWQLGLVGELVAVVGSGGGGFLPWL